MSSAAMPARCWRLFTFELLAVCGLCVCLSSAQLSSIDVTRGVEKLSKRFAEIKSVGLGVGDLEKTYLGAPYTFSTIADSDINTLLTDPLTICPINSVIALFNNISTNAVSSSPLIPAECCSSARDEACCHSCGSVDQQIRDTIAGAFSQTDLANGSQLLFGFSDGALLKYPALAPDNCSVLDARLQQWYGKSVRRALEVVIVLDLNLGNPMFIGDDDITRLREAANRILRSLTQQDRAAVVRSDRLGVIAPVVLQLAVDTVKPKTLPLCDETVSELEQFVTSVSDTTSNYTAALLEGVSLFSDGNDTDKVLVFLSSGFAPSQFTSPEKSIEALQTINMSIIDRGNDISVSVYKSIEASLPTDIYTDLSQVGLGGEHQVLGAVLQGNPLPVASQIGGYYSRFLSSSATPSPEAILGRGVNSYGENVLTVTQPFVNGSNLIGVFHALIPLDRVVLASLQTALRNRQSSYTFGVDLNRQLLFHPLLPGNILKYVHVTDFETDGVITGLLDAAQNSSMTQTGAVAKSWFLSVLRTENGGFVMRKIPSSYHCLQSNGLFFICVVLADEDSTVASLAEGSVNVADLYSSSPSRRPLFHEVSLSAPPNNQCDYFCKPSVSGRISFQLTAPNQPPNNNNAILVQQLSNYVSGDGSKPSWVQEGVVSDIGLGSAVATSWMNTSSSPSDFITRRHLATPRGVYLTFPPSQLNPQFAPTRSEWYTSATAHPNLLTLTPPHEDPLTEGGRFTVSLGYALRAPTAENDSSLGNGGQILSVVAAELTLDSLGVFIRKALPACDSNGGVDCFILDDMGNIIYDRAVVSNPMYSGGSHFLGQHFSQNMFHDRRTLITNLLRGEQILTKKQCADYFSVRVKTRRFYAFDTASTAAVQSIGGGSCIDYMIQRIPGTNAFLVALQVTRNCNSFCFCTPSFMPTCSDCGDHFHPTGCECPCVCHDDCKPTLNTSPCAVLIAEPDNYKAAATIEAVDASQPLCFNQNCNCRTSADSCLGVRDCNWCSAQGKCVYNSECCENSGSGDCCNRSPQIERFSVLGCNLKERCQDSSPSPVSVCPPPPTAAPNSAVIVAGVVGGLVALSLLGMIVGFFIWYQVFRREENTEETSRESAFDFSHKRTGATNPTAIEELKSDLSKNKSQSPATDSAAGDPAPTSTSSLKDTEI